LLEVADVSSAEYDDQDNPSEKLTISSMLVSLTFHLRIAETLCS
jgi:hypothetical protein